MVARYQNRISGPLQDRTDVRSEGPRLEHEGLLRRPADRYVASIALRKVMNSLFTR